jgi:hypothetical protein
MDDAARNVKPVNLYIRSESVILDAAKWLPHYSLCDRQALNNPTELYVWDLVYRFFGTKFCEWKELTVDRYSKSPGTVWHGSHGLEDYRQLASLRGLPLDPDMTVDGWDRLPGWKKG